jgi:hypothetical protein
MSVNPSPAAAGPPPSPPRSARSVVDDFDLLTDVLLPSTLFVMLGALVWFLIDVKTAVAEGPAGLLRWVFFFFMLAVVGLARIKARGTRLQAAPLSLALLAVMGLFGYLYAFGGGAFGSGFGGQRPMLTLAYNYAIIGFIWVAANYIVERTTIDPDDVVVNESESLTSEEWERRGAASEAVRRRPHPGRAVMFLSLAATLIFGLGQRALAGKPEFAGHAYGCMVIFAGSALATLAMTALNGLQLYARSRGARVPDGLAPLWLALAVPVAAAVLLAAHVAPRVQPRPNSWLPQFVPADSTYEGQLNGPVEGLGKAANPGGRPTPRGQGHGDQGRPAPGQGKGRQPGPTKGNNDGGGSKPGGQGPGQGGQGGKGGGEGKGGEQGKGGQEGPPDSSQTQGSEPSKQGDSDKSLPQSPPNQPQANPTPKPAAPDTGNLMALLVKALLALGGLALLAYGLWLALRRLQAWLAGRRRDGGPDPAAPTPPGPQRNPFVDPWGLRSPLRRQPPAEYVRYVYRAFQAFCALAGAPRRPDVTAREFLGELPASTNSWRAEIEALTLLYEAAEYTPESVDETCMAQLRSFWERLMVEVARVRS